MEVKFIKQNQITGKIIKGELTLKEFINYLETQNLQDGIDIKYINNLMVLTWN